MPRVRVYLERVDFGFLSFMRFCGFVRGASTPIERRAVALARTFGSVGFVGFLFMAEV